MAKPDDIEEIKARFRGRWAIRRHILDLDSEWLGKFTGIAVFSPVEAGLHYREEGKLQFGGLTAVRAERVYVWTVLAADRVRVLFEDGTHFHDFDPGQPRPKASHFCDPDDYDVTYDFSRWPEWRAEWRVEGPRKDYRLVSIYTREAARDELPR